MGVDSEGLGADPDEYIDANEVASILGLAHRNSVSTYRRRYPSFPAARPLGRGRALCWQRGEIVAWHEQFTNRRSEGGNGTNARLDDLVGATARLMLAHPGADIGIRQIAAEAGVAHSDLYRHAQSKDELRRRAVARINEDFQATLPATYTSMMADLEDVLAIVVRSRPALRAMASELIANPDAELVKPVPVARIAEMIGEDRVERDVESSVDPRVLAACMASVAWGIALFDGRWRRGMDLADIPLDQVARVMRAMLQA